jgi:hypothetical protein
MQYLDKMIIDSLPRLGVGQFSSTLGAGAAFSSFGTISVILTAT